MTNDELLEREETMVHWEIEFLEACGLNRGDKLFVRFTEDSVYVVKTDQNDNQEAPRAKVVHQPTEEELD